MFFTAAVPSALASDEPICVAASRPGASFLAAGGPAGPARPVTYLLNRRRCACERLSKSNKRSLNEPKKSPVDRCSCLTGFALFGLEILAGQAFVEMTAQAYALSVQQGESGSVLTRLALAHIVLCHVV